MFFKISKLVKNYHRNRNNQKLGQFLLKFDFFQVKISKKLLKNQNFGF